MNFHRPPLPYTTRLGEEPMRPSARVFCVVNRMLERKSPRVLGRSSQIESRVEFVVHSLPVRLHATSGGLRFPSWVEKRKQYDPATTVPLRHDNPKASPRVWRSRASQHRCWEHIKSIVFWGVRTVLRDVHAENRFQRLSFCFCFFVLFFLNYCPKGILGDVHYQLTDLQERLAPASRGQR